MSGMSDVSKPFERFCAYRPLVYSLLVSVGPRELHIVAEWISFLDPERHFSVYDHITPRAYRAWLNALRRANGVPEIEREAWEEYGYDLYDYRAIENAHMRFLDDDAKEEQGAC